MAKLPPKKSEDGGGDWLNTYADMVTLLLTFFVLLFACSNLDETKLQYVFQEFKMRGKYVNQVVAEQDPNAVKENGGVTDNADDIGGEGTMPESFEELYVYLAEYIDNNNLAQSVSIEQGEAYINIAFDSSVFFDGDSYYLKDEGKKVLDGFIPPIKALEHMFARNTVTGHTSNGTSIVNDWMLSSMRAVSVVNYLDANKTMKTEKYRVMGCGPYEPRSEDPAKNRRVEMMLLKSDLDFTDPSVIQDILEHDYNIGSSITDPNKQETEQPNYPPGSVDKIIGFIKDKFDSDGVSNVGSYGPAGVNGDKFISSEGSDGGDKTGGEGSDTTS